MTLRLEDLDYALPGELIAQHPAARREDARLLVVERATGALHDQRITDLGRWLSTGDALAPTRPGCARRGSR
jgi:S-adenosylmethionine:tRNA ribosyltransferase-isomerase